MTQKITVLAYVALLAVACGRETTTVESGGSTGGTTGTGVVASGGLPALGGQGGTTSSTASVGGADASSMGGSMMASGGDATGGSTLGQGGTTAGVGGVTFGEGGVTFGEGGVGSTVLGGATSLGLGGAAGVSGGLGGNGTGEGGSTATAVGGTATEGGTTLGAGGSGQLGGATTTGEGGAAGTGTGGVAGSSYALPPPSQCHNQNYIDFQAGCIEGDPNSVCGGKCNVINACQENSTMKPYADTAFICPRFMLFSDQMLQAASDDGLSDFNYAVVGHDVDSGGIDAGTESTCCQCYQLVYATPSPSNERQCLANPDSSADPTSAIAIPKPLIVQSFNTAATPTTFDVYMAAGGFGANNSCGPGLSPASASGLYLYTAYPPDGQPGQGGVKPVSLFQECKNETNWVTQATLSSEACQSRVQTTCNMLESSIPGLTEQSRRSCIESNSPTTPYHLNWAVYAMKVECPVHLTDVTGCKLSNQGLPAADPTVTTAAQAASDPRFWTTSGSGQMYETTTMEDCCRPSCAAIDWVEKRGLPVDSDYNAFYSCDVNGNPITE